MFSSVLEQNSSPHDENNNNDNSGSSDQSASSIEDVCEKSLKLGSYTLSARGNTWIGRRGVRRELMQHETSSASELDVERMCSVKLAEKNEQCSKEIDFRVDFVLETATDKLDMRFSFLEHLPSHYDMTAFDTLVHFLHLYVNTSMEKCFAQWVPSTKTNS